MILWIMLMYFVLLFLGRHIPNVNPGDVGKGGKPTVPPGAFH